MKSILYIGAFRLPAGNAAAQRVRSNAKILRDLGYRVVLVGIDSDPNETRAVVRRGSYVRDGFHSISINVGGGRFGRVLKRLSAVIPRRLMDRRASPAAAVICYNHPAVPQALIQIAAHCRAVAFLPDATEWYGPDGNAPLRDAAKWLDTTVRMRILNRFARAFITTSPYLTRFYDGAGRAVLELPTLYDRDQLAPATGIVAATEGELRLVYAGQPFNIEARRPKPSNMKERLDKVIDVVAAANLAGARYRLDLYGLTREQYLRALPHHGYVVDGAAGWLAFHGRVSQAVVVDAVRDAHFTIFLRDDHRVNRAGFPSKFAESITAGTAVMTNIMANLTPFAVEEKNSIALDGLDEAASARRLVEVWKERAAIVGKTKAYCAETAVFDYRNWIDRSRDFAREVFGSP